MAVYTINIRNVFPVIPEEGNIGLQDIVLLKVLFEENVNVLDKLLSYGINLNDIRLINDRIVLQVDDDELAERLVAEGILRRLGEQIGSSVDGGGDEESSTDTDTQTGTSDELNESGESSESNESNESDNSTASESSESETASEGIVSTLPAFLRIECAGEEEEAEEFVSMIHSMVAILSEGSDESDDDFVMCRSDKNRQYILDKYENDCTF